MQFGNKCLNNYNTVFGIFLKLKRIYCKILRYNFELQNISQIKTDNGLSCCIYGCKICGSMSFEVI